MKDKIKANFMQHVNMSFETPRRPYPNIYPKSEDESE